MWRWWLILGGLIWLVACVPAGTTPLPTIVTLPPVPQTFLPTLTPLPATFTPPPATPTITVTPSPTPCASPGRIVQASYASDITGDLVAYRVYLPPCYGLDGRVYPTLYLFSGNIHDDSEWDNLGLDETAEAGITAGRWPPFLIVMPDGGWIANTSSGGPNSFEGLFLTELMPLVEQDYCAWVAPAGRAIGGLSRGGYWALEIAFRNPQLFASVGGHSASLLDYSNRPDYLPQFTAFSHDLSQLRIYLDIGQNDYLRSYLEPLHQEMDAAGIAHTWQLNLGTHEESYWADHLKEYLTWYVAPWPHARFTYPTCSS